MAEVLSNVIQPPLLRVFPRLWTSNVVMTEERTMMRASLMQQSGQGRITHNKLNLKPTLNNQIVHVSQGGSKLKKHSKRPGGTVANVERKVEDSQRAIVDVVGKGEHSSMSAESKEIDKFKVRQNFECS